MSKMATRFITTTEARLDLLPISNGQLIFVRDSRRMCHDYDGERIEYGQIIVLNDENHRLSIAEPFNTFYFVLDTRVLWRYQNEWIPLTTSAKESVIFVGDGELPEVGTAGTLYATTTDLYTWNGSSYTKMGTLYWEEF